MLRFTLRRILLLIPQLLIVLVATFIIVKLTPGNQARAQLGSTATPEALAALEARLGLDRPILEQFFLYMRNIAQGDFGQSWVSGQSVSRDLLQRGPATLELITLGLIGSVAVAIPLGVAAAVRRGAGIFGRLLDRISYGYSLMAGTIPDFWFALILIFVFFTTLGIAPAPVGQLDFGITRPPGVTNMLLIDSAIAGNWAAFGNHASKLVLPVVTLTFVSGAVILRMTRNNVVENMGSEYIRFARACGLPNHQLVRYALRNSLVPVVTLAGVVYTLMIGGAVLTETIFSWAGLGQYVVQSLQNADWAALQAVVLLSAALALIVYLLLDLINAAIDPRIRLGRS